MPRRRWSLPFVLGLGAAAAAQSDLRAVLPADSLAVVAVADGPAALRELGHALGAVPKDLPPEVAALVAAGLLGVRAAIGGPVDEVVHTLAAGGAALGLVRQGDGFEPLVALRPGRLDAAAAWVRARGAPWSCEVRGDLLLVSRSAAAAARFVAAGAALERAPAPPGAAGTVLSGSADLAALRAALGERAPRVEALDGGGRFLLAPIVHALASASRLHFAVEGGAALTLRLDADAGPGDSRWGRLQVHGGAPRQHLPFAADGLLLVSIDRSFRALLRDAADLLDESGQLAVQGFLSIAEALDGASTSFQDDLLGGFVEPFTLHVLPAPPPLAGEPVPPIVLPGIAVTAPIARPAVVPILGRMAQVLATIANGERAQRGLRPFVLRAVRGEHGQGFVAEAPEWRGPGLPPTEAMLSPTILWGHGHAVLASTRAAAERLLALAAGGTTTTVAGDRVILRGPQVAAALGLSRRALELGRMLDEGEDAAAAQRFFSSLIAVAAAVRELSLDVAPHDGGTRLELRLERAR